MTSPRKQTAIDFAKATPNSDFTFVVKGDKADALRYLQAVRVELSRLRDYVRAKGLTVKPFRMVTKEIIDNGNGTATVTVFKDAGGMEIAKDIDNIFDHIAGGPQI